MNINVSIPPDPKPPSGSDASPDGGPSAGPAFSQRPWPQRSQADSPLVGRRVCVIDPDEQRGRQLQRELGEHGLVIQWLPGPGLDLRCEPQELDLLLYLHPAGPGAALLEQLSASCTLIAKQHLPSGLPPARIWAQLPAPMDATAVLSAFGRALERAELEAENAGLRAQLDKRLSLGPLVSRDAAMGELLETARTVADTRATVLLLGESGTGKSLLARALHAHSLRAAEPFVVVNCGALPGPLLESELFGHAKGAFTGAVQDKLGRFELASSGTLFLDEINSAPPELQVKLLRVLQERSFERVGESTTRQTNARVIAASNQDLLAEVQAGRFREDLYWRLNVVSLELPPLRQRPADLAILVERFLVDFAQEYERPLALLSPEALGAVAAYAWPGNVRQLMNALERAVLLATGPEINLECLPPEVRAAALKWPQPGLDDSLESGLQVLSGLADLPTLKEALAAPERAILVRALELARGSRKDAADSLGINRTTLFNKMKKYALMDLSFARTQP